MTRRCSPGWPVKCRRIGDYDQRVHYLARTPRWADAADAIAQVTKLNPADHLSWHFQATLHLQVGDLEAVGRDCEAMMERFGATSDALVAQRIAIACLLMPDPRESRLPASSKSPGRSRTTRIPVRGKPSRSAWVSIGRESEAGP